MADNFNILVHKLKLFRKKYYSYRLLKGFVWWLFFIVLIYSGLALVEYVVYFSSEVRKILFFGFLLFAGLLLLQFVGLPLLRLLRVLKPMDDKTTTALLQNHFSDIEDKLLNVLELSEITEQNYSSELILASINQKIEQLSVFNFNDAVQFKTIKNVLITLLISIMVTSGLFIVNKNFYTESTRRLVHYNQTFTKPAPFEFNLNNTELAVKKGESYTISVSTNGREIPQIVYINIEGNNYLMTNSEPGRFEFEMISVIHPVQFHFTDLQYKSESYQLQLLPKPGITNFSAHIEPPHYTLMQSQVFSNVGDLQVPNGTAITWQFEGIDIDSLYVVINDSMKIRAEEINNRFEIKSKFYQSTQYNVYVQNRITQPELALSYAIDVVPDIFPEIDVAVIQDSVQLSRYFFKGIVGDDYGFTDLRFHYTINQDDSTIAIPFVKALTDQEFYFTFDFNSIAQRKENVSYYFSVTDNDVVNNYKTTTSDSYTFVFPNREELLASEKEQFEQLQQNFNESRELAREIQDDLKNLQLKNMDSNVSDWEKSQMVNDIVGKQNRLEKLYNEIKQDNAELKNYMNSFSGNSEKIKQKQQEIEELLNEVFTDELKMLMEEFNKLAEEFNSKKLNQLSDDMKLTYEDLQKQLDRNLEMLKKMKMEQSLQNVIDEVNRIAEEEEKLSESILEKKDFDEGMQTVEQHQSENKNLEQEVKDVLELNEGLENPLNFDDFSEDFDQIDQSFEESKKELQKKNQKKAGAATKSTSEKMKNLAFGMQQMLDMNKREENQENIENLKQILSNLMVLSFSQEDILMALAGINNQDPALNDISRNQKRVSDQSKIVKDSLYTLAMRTPHITSMVNNELLRMEMNLQKANDELGEGLYPNARTSQQFVITAVNNLALMLNEALENMENQMNDGESGGENSGKPGKPGMGGLKKASENIREQLQQMIEQMKSGNMEQMSQQMGKSLMQHEMMQQMLRELMNSSGVGSEAKQGLQQIDKLLEQNRKELMNKNINAQTLARQNLITTRLLEAENAELEREQEEKRESKTADEFYSNPVKFFEYKEKENFSIEYLNRNAHQLQKFYNQKYKDYLKNMESNP